MYVLDGAYFYRSIVSCWSLAGGRAGAPFCEGLGEQVLPGVVDKERIPADPLMGMETTGSGPLKRELGSVDIGMLPGKASARTACAVYGVALVPGEDGGPRIDAAATPAMRAKLRQRRGSIVFFGRRLGHRRLAGRGDDGLEVVP